MSRLIRNKLIRGVLISGIAGGFVQATQTSVAIDYFADNNPRISLAPGNVGVLSGSMYPHAIGPSTTGISAPGRAALVYANFLASSSFTYNDGVYAEVQAWIYFTNFGAAVVAGHSDMFIGAQKSGSLVWGYGVRANGDVYYGGTAGLGSSSIVTLSLQTWYQFYFVCYKTPGNSNLLNVTLGYRQLGSPNFTLLPAGTGPVNVGGGSAPTGVGVAMQSSAGSYTYAARIGAVGYYLLGSPSDATPDTSVTDPPSYSPTTWYVNGNGNDTNDGLSPSTAWLTINQVDIESAYGGMIPNVSGSGDSLVIDNTINGRISLFNRSLLVQTPGLNISIIGELQAWSAVPSGAWSKTAGKTHLYQQSIADQEYCVWENDAWMNHPSLNSYGSEAALLTAMDSVANSFYVTADGTTLYLYSSDGSNPASNGKTYTRSLYRNDASVSGSSAIDILVPNVTVTASGLGPHVWKTCLCGHANTETYNSYGLQFDVGSGGVSTVTGLYVAYWGKHGIGDTNSGSNGTLQYLNVRMEQGSPYVSFGGQTAMVDFNGSGSATGNTVLWQTCTVLKNVGSVGSTTGSQDPSFAIYITHNGGTGTQFSNITIDGCNFAGQAIDATNATAIEFDLKRLANYTIRPSLPQTFTFLLAPSVMGGNATLTGNSLFQ